jgi:hypothetical protein
MNEGIAMIRETSWKSLFLRKVALDVSKLDKPEIRVKQVDSYNFSDISERLSG